ncbi:mitophagy [Branchiostoma belcheri]|nr:mitophagy [Branchiostoma belcheri]
MREAPYQYYKATVPTSCQGTVGSPATAGAAYEAGGTRSGLVDLCNGPPDSVAAFQLSQPSDGTATDDSSGRERIFWVDATKCKNCSKYRSYSRCSGTRCNTCRKCRGTSHRGEQPVAKARTMCGERETTKLPEATAEPAATESGSDGVVFQSKIKFSSSLQRISSRKKEDKARGQAAKGDSPAGFEGRSRPVTGCWLLSNSVLVSNRAWAGPGLMELRDGRRILLVRRHVLNEGDREGSDRGGESMTLSYVFVRTAEGSLVLVQSVMHHCDPDRRSHVNGNPAHWLPRTDRGLIYGINREHLQICRLGYEPGSPQEQPAEPRLRCDVVRSGRTPQERQYPNLFCRFALYVPEYLQHAFGQTWTVCTSLSKIIEIIERGNREIMERDRRLFGPVDHEELERDLRPEIAAIHQESRRKWDSDFDSDSSLSLDLSTGYLLNRSVPILRVLPLYLENLYDGTTFP